MACILSQVAPTISSAAALNRQRGLALHPSLLSINYVKQLTNVIKAKRIHLPKETLNGITMRDERRYN